MIDKKTYEKVKKRLPKVQKRRKRFQDKGDLRWLDYFSLEIKMMSFIHDYESWVNNG